jgi:uncharacterized membrane protein YkoI
MYRFSLHAALICYVSNWSFEYQYNILIQGKAVAAIYGCKGDIDQTNRVYQKGFVVSILQGVLAVHRIDVQMSNSGNMTGNMMGNSTSSSNSMGSNMMAIPAKAPVLNITTAAPPMTPAVFGSMASQIHIDLTKATMIAEKWVGGNSHALSSMIGIQNGSPVYTIWIIDSNSGLHQIVVDPQNGKIMFVNQPMFMTGPFS